MPVGDEKRNIKRTYKKHLTLSSPQHYHHHTPTTTSSPVVSPHRCQNHPSHGALVDLLGVTKRVKQVIICEHPPHSSVPQRRAGLRDRVVLPGPRRSRAVPLLPLIVRAYSHADLDVFIALSSGSVVPAASPGGGLDVGLHHSRLGVR